MGGGGGWDPVSGSVHADYIVIDAIVPSSCSYKLGQTKVIW